MALNDTHTIPSNPLVTTDVKLAAPQTIPQADMLEALQTLSPQQRTELVTDWYLFWVTFHTQYRLID